MRSAVWNRNSAKTKPLIDAGAKLFASPAELVEGCEVTIVMLLNDAATEAVYRGPNGILKARLAGKLVIDMSTVRPDTMKSVGTAALQQGAAFVECPVGGSIGPAKEGKLLGLVGGTKADVARAMPMLEQLCRRIEHVGELGAGSTMKLAVNLPLLVYWQALGEALTICKPLNLPADRLIDILSDTAGAPTAMKGRGAVIAKVSGRRAARRDRLRPQCRRKDLAARFNSARPSMPNFRSRQARSLAMRKPKPRAWARPTPPRFRLAGPSARPSRSSSYRRRPQRTFESTAEIHPMIDRKNRYGRTAARVHDADGLARRPRPPTIDIHAHIVVPQAAKLAQPHVDLSRIPLAHFADAATREINAQQEKDVARGHDHDRSPPVRSRQDGHRYPGRRAAHRAPMLLFDRSQDRGSRASPRQ